MTRLFGARPSDTRTLVGTSVALPAPAGEVDQRRWCSIVSQIGDECVGASIANAHWMAVGNRGHRASRRCIYANARARERARKGDALVDAGCQPDDAFSSLVAVGVCPENARDFDPGAIMSTNTVEEIVASQKFSMDDLATIDDGDTDTLRAWLTLGARQPDHGIGATFVMQVDQSYMQLSGEGFWDGMQGPSEGGHQQIAMGYRIVRGVLCIEVLNTWPDWGAAGYAYIPVTRFAQIATEMVVVKGGPRL